MSRRKPEEYGRVAVLMGGWSGERDISLKSGNAVLAALRRQGVDAHAVDLTRETARCMALEGYDRVFIALHGECGEDGTLQGCMDMAGMPYTGTGVLGSALGMDKLACKRLWAGTNLPSAPYRLLTPGFDPEAVADALGLPLIVKPRAVAPAWASPGSIVLKTCRPPLMRRACSRARCSPNSGSPDASTRLRCSATSPCR